MWIYVPSVEVDQNIAWENLSKSVKFVFDSACADHAKNVMCGMGKGWYTFESVLLVKPDGHDRRVSAYVRKNGKTWVRNPAKLKPIKHKFGTPEYWEARIARAVRLQQSYKKSLAKAKKAAKCTSSSSSSAS